MLASLAVLSLGAASWRLGAENVFVQVISTLILIVSGLSSAVFVYYVDHNMIVYNDPETINIQMEEQPANINGAVLTTKKKSKTISVSSNWLYTLDSRLPKLVGKLNDEAEKRDLIFCVKSFKEDLSKVTSLVGADNEKEIKLENKVISCLRKKGYNLN
jgi:hypothetical protein